MVIDAHLHLDPRVDGTADGAARELNQQLNNFGVDRALVLHLESQPWPVEVVASAILKYPRLSAFINIDPYDDSAVPRLKRGINELGFVGLKLHPRLQEYPVDGDMTIQLVREAGKLNVPVLIDAFPDGTHLMQGFSALRYAKLATECSDTKMVWAHMGGHHVLDFMMLAKRLPNVYMDLSYSLLYYQNSPTVDNMIYAMRSMKFERIFYGSDYPDRSVGISLENSINVLSEKGLSDIEMRNILYLNANKFFKWRDQK